MSEGHTGTHATSCTFYGFIDCSLRPGAAVSASNFSQICIKMSHKSPSVSQRVVNMEVK